MSIEEEIIYAREPISNNQVIYIKCFKNDIYIWHQHSLAYFARQSDGKKTLALSAKYLSLFRMF